MSNRDKGLYVLLGCLLMATPVLAAAVDPPQREPVVLAVSKPDRPAPEASGFPQEDPMEDEKITAALEAAGYFRPEVPLSYELQDALHTACARYGVDYTLALGLIEVESGFDPDAVSPSGCYGLCQLNPRYFPAGLSPADNIEAGMAYLGGLLEEYGGTAAALTAYNAGTDTGRREYANAVLASAENWREP